MWVDRLLSAAQSVSSWVIPFLLVFIPCYAHAKGVKTYERFVQGAQEGMAAAVRILPYLLTMWIAVSVCRAGGTFDAVARLLQPLFAFFGIPAEIFPLLAVRMFSGSGALSVASEIMSVHGPDSPVGLLTSILLGSGETTFYVVTVYLGAVNLHRTRHILPAALVGNLVGFIAAVALWRLWLRG